MSGQVAFWVLGKAITSRMEEDPVKSIINRSTPKAMPPWGGAPSSRARSKEAEFFLGFFVSDSKRLEDGFLHQGAVDTN